MSTSSTAAVTTAQHKTFFGKLIASIGSFFTGLLNSAKKAFNALPADKQRALIHGVNISQLIKDGYSKGEAYVVTEVSSVTGLSTADSTNLVLSLLKDMGINVTSVQAGLDAIANKVQAGISDNGWNALWSNAAAFVASYLTGGGLNWASLLMGLVEFAYQHFIAAKKTA